MAVSDKQLAAVKRYMRVDGDDDDAVIGALLEAAILYLRDAGIDEPAEESALYNLATWGLTLHYYDHRDAVGTEAALPLGIRPIITQLKLTRPTQS